MKPRERPDQTSYTLGFRQTEKRGVTKRKFLLDGKTFWEYFAFVITYRVSSNLKVYPLIF